MLTFNSKWRTPIVTGQVHAVFTRMGRRDFAPGRRSVRPRSGYALLDRSKTIGREHLDAALAVWKYSQESVQKLFKGKSGSNLADWVYGQLENGPMRTTEFHSHRNLKGEDLREALEQLEHNDRIRRVVIKKKKGAGRPTEMWQRV